MAMTDMIIEIMVEVLTVLAIATKEMKRGRISELIPSIDPFIDSDIFRKVSEETYRKHRGRG